MNRITAARKQRRQRLESLGTVALPSPFVRVVIEHGMTHRLSTLAQEYYQPPRDVQLPKVVHEEPVRQPMQRKRAG